VAASLRIYSRGISSPNLPTYSSGLPRGGHPTSLPIPLDVWRRIDPLSGKDAEPWLAAAPITNLKSLQKRAYAS
jgi:hypothetical protein